jgi:hypothetical protein
MIPRVSVRGWGACDVSNGSPKLSFIDPLLRRRMSRLSRMVISAAFDSCRSASCPVSRPRVVLATRHGEGDTLGELLDCLSLGEPLSPTAFTGSVHHTSSGFFGITAQNTLPARAVGAGAATFPAGFLDALGLLSDDSQTPVLLISADDFPPPPLNTLVTETLPHSVAFLLEAGGDISFETQPEGHRPEVLDEPSTGGAIGAVPALDFLKWFLSDRREFSLTLSGRRWQWNR